MKIRYHERTHHTYIVRKRRFFCWIPTLGSDEDFHWLTRITRWELLCSDGAYHPISEITKQTIYGVWPVYWYGGIESELEEGIAKNVMVD